MDRRRFLTTLGTVTGLVGVPGLLAACGGTGSIPDGPATRNVINPTFELLTGEGRHYAFGLTAVDGNEPVRAADPAVYVRAPDGEILSGPYEATYHDDEVIPAGLYSTALDLDREDALLITVVDGDAWGEAAVRVVDPANSEMPAPGQPAIAVSTATTAEQGGLARLCTADPACGMHETSLDAALADGRPVVLLFATPAYCQTTVCGPAVETVDAVRAGADYGEVAWVHVEIYTDEGQTLADPVEQWGLRSEPWLYTIGSGGEIAERIDGPMIPDVVAGLAGRLA